MFLHRIGAGIAVMALVLAAGCSGEDGKQGGGGSGGDAVTTDALLHAAVTNYQAIHAEYAGKRITLKGRVTQTGEKDGAPFLMLGPMAEARKVQAFLYKESAPEVQKIWPGQVVTLSGVVDASGAITLEGARVVKE